MDIVILAFITSLLTSKKYYECTPITIQNDIYKADTTVMFGSLINIT